MRHRFRRIRSRHDKYLTRLDEKSQWRPNSVLKHEKQSTISLQKSSGIAFLPHMNPTFLAWIARRSRRHAYPRIFRVNFSPGTAREVLIRPRELSHGEGLYSSDGKDRCQAQWAWMRERIPPTGANTPLKGDKMRRGGEVSNDMVSYTWKSGQAKTSQLTHTPCTQSEAVVRPWTQACPCLA